MSDTLTKHDLLTLQKPFPFDDHEFLRGYAYLKEDVIGQRLEDVDPAWTFEIQRIDVSGQNVVVVARMTVKGVAREGVGMQQINEKAGEAEKGAATDAFKRCARLFGVGRYLVTAPKDERGFGQWLAKLSGTQPQPQRRVVTVTSETDLDAALGTTPPATTYPVGDLRHKATQEAFVERWRKEGLSGAEIAAALGVQKWSEWTKGSKAADEAVETWLKLNLPKSKAS